MRKNRLQMWVAFIFLAVDVVIVTLFVVRKDIATAIMFTILGLMMTHLIVEGVKR